MYPSHTILLNLELTYLTIELGTSGTGRDKLNIRMPYEGPVEVRLAQSSMLLYITQISTNQRCTPESAETRRTLLDTPGLPASNGGVEVG